MAQSQVVTVEFVREIPLADRIECIKVLGWWVIVPKGVYAVGSACVFIFPETVVPGYFAESQGIKKTRIRAMKMRGIVSEGLIQPLPTHAEFDRDDTDGWFGLRKYEPPASKLPGWLQKGRIRPSNPDFPRHRDTENIKKSTHLWAGRQVIATVKVHGMNVRFGWVNGEWQVGSRNVDLQTAADDVESQSIFERAVEHLKSRCPNTGNYVFIGEIYGKGIQDLDYGVTEKDGPQVVVFAVLEQTLYLPFDKARDLAVSCVIPFVPVVYRADFDFERLEILAASDEDPHFFPGVKHLREGLVISDSEHMLPPMKLISPRYLMRDKGTEWA